MSAIGISPALANAWLDTLRNVPFTVPLFCVQLYVGVPGVDGTMNLSAVTSRVAVGLAAASGGGITLTGAPPQWSMTAAETISHAGVWSGLGDDAIFLMSGVLLAPKDVASGDKFTLNSSNVSFSALAAS